MKLFCIVLGCTLKGRNTEQHDTFFTIAESLEDALPAIKNFWPEAENRLHIDCYREVTSVDGYRIEIENRNSDSKSDDGLSLFFINLGGYKENEFEEYHYKILSVAKDKSDAISASKKTAFYKHFGFKGAESHIDDKFGVDVDDIFNIDDILSKEEKDKYKIVIRRSEVAGEDELHIGYVKLSKLESA